MIGGVEFDVGLPATVAVPGMSMTFRECSADCEGGETQTYEYLGNGVSQIHLNYHSHPPRSPVKNVNPRQIEDGL